MESIRLIESTAALTLFGLGPNPDSREKRLIELEKEIRARKDEFNALKLEDLRCALNSSSDWTVKIEEKGMWAHENNNWDKNGHIMRWLRVTFIFKPSETDIEVMCYMKYTRHDSESMYFETYVQVRHGSEVRSYETDMFHEHRWFANLSGDYADPQGEDRIQTDLFLEDVRASLLLSDPSDSCFYSSIERCVRFLAENMDKIGFHW